MNKSAFIRYIKENLVTFTLVAGRNYSWLSEKRPEALLPRTIHKIQTNGIYLNDKSTRSGTSWLEFPPASLMNIEESDTYITVQIFNPGIREMNEDEKKNLEAFQKAEAEYEKENPYSDSFWFAKGWINKCSTPWISFLGGKTKGKQAAQGGNYGMIMDDSIKGEMILEYKVEII